MPRTVRTSLSTVSSIEPDEDGVLAVTIPVIAKAKPRKVKIAHAGVAAKTVAPELAAV